MQLFFFSSRRRHTRSLCDWSSDVCSSDLEMMNMPGVLHGDVQVLAKIVATQRSEERRVGKECRAQAPAEGQNENSLPDRQWRRERRRVARDAPEHGRVGQGCGRWLRAASG